MTDITKTSCTLTWDVPDFDGGSPITGYYVEKFSGTRWSKVNKKPVKNLSMEFDDLIEMSEYEFRVIAENDAGQSKPSDGCGQFKAKDPFDPPGRPDAPEPEMAKDSAKLTWKPPESDGGAPITNYIIEMRRCGDVKWVVCNKTEKVPGLEFTVTGLVEETDYEFRITAENKAGPGQPSPPSKPSKYSKSDFTVTSVNSTLPYGVIYCCNNL